MQTQDEVKELVSRNIQRLPYKTKRQTKAHAAVPVAASPKYNIMADDYNQLEGYNHDAD